MYKIGEGWDKPAIVLIPIKILIQKISNKFHKNLRQVRGDVKQTISSSDEQMIGNFGPLRTKTVKPERHKQKNVREIMCLLKTIPLEKIVIETNRTNMLTCIFMFFLSVFNLGSS